MTNTNIIDPDSWDTQNESALIFVDSAGGYSGQYAACLHVVWDKMMKKFTGAALNSTGAIPVAHKFKYLLGYCKIDPDDADTLKIVVNMYSMNKLVGYGSKGFIHTPNHWHRFEVPINYFSNEKPDHAKINISVVPVKGSYHQTKYYIDDLYFSDRLK